MHPDPVPMVTTSVWVNHVLALICVPPSSSVCLSSGQSNGHNVWKSLGCFSQNPGGTGWTGSAVCAGSGCQTGRMEGPEAVGSLRLAVQLIKCHSCPGEENCNQNYLLHLHLCPSQVTADLLLGLITLLLGGLKSIQVFIMERTFHYILW